MEKVGENQRPAPAHPFLSLLPPLLSQCENCICARDLASGLLTILHRENMIA